MPGPRMAAYALLLLVFVAALGWGLQQTGDGAVMDADLVYCLAPAHQDGLVDAAVSLGLAGAGSTPDRLHMGGRDVTLAAWRAADGAGFQRACDAYATASRPASAPGSATPAAGLRDVVNVLLPVIAGAVLTMAADDFKQISDRRWALADELRADWAAFQAAVLSYVRRRRDLLGAVPVDDDIDTKRRTLTATLRKVHSRHRKWPSIRLLQDILNGDLGGAIVDGWGMGDASGSATSVRAAEITDCLSTFGSTLENVAGVLERRVWLPSRL